MSFVSYAQNFEDVMLWRALKHIHQGVYVDVGAQHPVIDSVSKAFYERGWRGIHIEPVPYYAKLLRKDRPDETVLQVALADREGTLELNVIADTGLSTGVDAYAQRHLHEQGYQSQRLLVPVLTLTSALQSLAGQDIHWLKIDVEGMEEPVLKGWDSKVLRPWILVVEATVPNSPNTDFARWDAILTNADYRFVYFDGLNRFYIANEQAGLAEAFSCPPNVFDDIEITANSSLGRGLIAQHQANAKDLSAQIQALTVDLKLADEDHARLQARFLSEQNELNEAKARLSNLVSDLQSELDDANAHSQSQISGLQQELEQARQTVRQLEQELQQLYASRSWRMTRPLRFTMLTIKRSLAWLMRRVLTSPQLTVWALPLLGRFPRLKQHLRLFAIRSGLIAASSQTTALENPDQAKRELSVRAAAIAADLKQAIEKRKV